jgi:tetratricopeptide repeat protein 21B
MSADKYLPFLRYYAREGYARHLQSICAEMLKKRPGDPFLVFWKAYGLIAEGSQAEVPRLGRGQALRDC